MEIKKALLDCLKNEFVEEERRVAFHQFNDFFVESILNLLKSSKLEMIGSVASNAAELRINTQLDEMAMALKNARNNKGE